MALTDEGNNITLESALVSKGFISPVTAKMISSKILDISFVDLYVMDIDPATVRQTEKETCLKYCCLPIGKLFGSEVIVTDCVLDGKTEDLKKIFGENIELQLAVKDEILRVIDKVFA